MGLSALAAAPEPARNGVFFCAKTVLVIANCHSIGTAARLQPIVDTMGWMRPERRGEDSWGGSQGGRVVASGRQPPEADAGYLRAARPCLARCSICIKWLISWPANIFAMCAIVSLPRSACIPKYSHFSGGSDPSKARLLSRSVRNIFSEDLASALA